MKEKYQLVQLGMLRSVIQLRICAGSWCQTNWEHSLIVGFISGSWLSNAFVVPYHSLCYYLWWTRKSWQSGYPCNENLETSPPCSPCWQNNRCDYNRMCLDSITEIDVLDAVQRLEKRLNLPIETEMAILP